MYFIIGIALWATLNIAGYAALRKVKLHKLDAGISLTRKTGFSFISIALWAIAWPVLIVVAAIGWIATYKILKSEPTRRIV